jgi:hypothetical protein
VKQSAKIQKQSKQNKIKQISMESLQDALVQCRVNMLLFLSQPATIEGTMVSAAQGQLNDGAPTREPELEQMPEVVRKVKERLEKETGKTYRYQPGKKDMPSVGELLKHGAPGATPPSFQQSLKNAIMLAALFSLSLFIFHHTVLTRPSTRIPYKLPRRAPQRMDKNAGNVKERRMHVEPLVKESETMPMEL